MGEIDSWLEKDVAPIEKKYDACDFPGTVWEVVRCTHCDEIYEVFRKSDVGQVWCPYCKLRGVEVVKMIRKIWLQ